MARVAIRCLALAVVVSFATPGTAAAEPYLAVFKGMQCSSCHSHPGGGGMRNNYGNVFAQNELANARLGAEQAPLWTGQVVDRLAIGGNLRAEYRYVDTPDAESASAFDVARASVYLQAYLVPGRLSIYVDQQLAPGSSLNREAYVRVDGVKRKFFAAAGQFFLPFGLRLQDDTAFVRLVTGVNFTVPDRGLQVGYESGPWSSLFSVTNGSGGGAETDRGKQVSIMTTYVRPGWRAGASYNTNDSDFGDRQMQNIFLGLRTGPIAWLAEIDLITDQPVSDVEQNALAGLIEANWLLRRGHNLKLSYEYLDPDDDISEDQRVRYSVLWEYTPMQFLQARMGARLYDGIPQVAAQNRNEIFIEFHAFF